MPTARISEYNANRLLEAEFEDGAWIEPRSADPGEDGTGGVIVGASRVFVGAAGWSVAVGKALHNVDQIDFAELPECEIAYFAAMDAETAGNFLRSCPRLAGSPPEVTPLSVPEGATATIPAEECVFSFENVEV